MRITITHNKNPQDVIKLIDRGVEEAYKTVPAGMVHIADAQRSWEGNSMAFSFVAKAGFISSPVRGTVDVTDKDVTVDVDLGLLGKFISEDTARQTIEGRVKGLLTDGKS